MPSLRKQLAQRTAAGNTANALFDLHCRNLKQIHEAGMIIGVGTDGTGDGFGVHQQIEYYVRCAGFTPAQALQAATSINARLLGLARMGTVAAGKEADFVVLSANPLERITNTPADRHGATCGAPTSIARRCARRSWRGRNRRVRQIAVPAIHTPPTTMAQIPVAVIRR